jgi:hypothetical protein
LLNSTGTWHHDAALWTGAMIMRSASHTADSLHIPVLRFGRRITIPIGDRPLYRSMISVEPRLLDIAVDAYRTPKKRNYWPAYEVLKRRGQSLVGWDAKNPELQSEACWREFLDTIEYLLSLEPRE